MNKNSKSKRLKVNKKQTVYFSVFLILVVILILILYNVIKLIINPTEAFILNDGILSSEESAIGYIIRDESIIQTDNSGSSIKQIKAEGEKVSKGEAVFRYCGDNEQEIQNKIDELNIKIQESLNGQTNLFSSDIKALDNKIESEIDGLDNKNNIVEINETKNRIDGYINKKSEIAGELSPAGSYIKELIAERSEYEKQINEQAQYVNSESSGLVSYRIDGFENAFPLEDFSYINVEFLENLNLTTGQMIPTNENQCKIINNFECYIAIVSDSDEAEKAKVGDKLAIALANSKEAEVEIVYKKQDGKKQIIVVKTNRYIEDLINYRKMNFDIIWWKEEGLKLPKSAIIYENGLAYIMRTRNEKTEKILVKVVAQSEGQAIIKQYSTKELKNLGYTLEEINSMKKIARYDEIVLNPNIK